MKGQPKNGIEREELFANHQIFTRLIPLTVLLIVFINIIVHSIFWIIEVKNTKVI